MRKDRLISYIRQLPIVVLIPNGSFRNWWIASGLGQASVTIAPMALAWVIYEGTDSSSWVGLVNGIPVLAIVPLTLAGGVLLDRVGRLRVFRQTHLGLAVAFGILAIALSNVSLHPLLLIPIAAAVASASSVQVLASRLIITEMVDRDMLASALSLSYVLRSLLVMIGPPLMGIIIALSSVGLFFGILSAVHLIAWLATLLLNIRETTLQQASGSILSSVREGLRYCYRTPAVAWLLVIGLMAMFGNTYLAFLALYARDILEIGVEGFGLLIAAESVGGIFGALVLGTVGRVRLKGVTVILSAIVYALAMIVFAYSTNANLSLISMFVIGAMGAVWIALMNACIQLVTEPNMRGRIVALYSTIARSVKPLGFLLGGILALAMGASTALLISAMIQIVFYVFVLVWIRAVREIQ